MGKSCKNNKIENEKPCYSLVVRHKKCGHIGCNSKGDCTNSIMTKMGRCQGCDEPISIDGLENIE